jgi:hypothetical protein
MKATYSGEKVDKGRLHVDKIASMGDNLRNMTRIVPQKSQIMQEIAILLGLPDFKPGVGSSVPSVFFTSIASEMGVPVVQGMPNMARKIIESSHLPWLPEFSSENMPSGGGGTVTALGLMQLKNAVLIWKGLDPEQLPIEMIREEWKPETSWSEIRKMLPREIQEVIARPGASEFRTKVLNEYGNRCAISGFTSLEAIEVAHIIPYYGQDSDVVWNAIPLRTDLHRLFDRGLIRLNYSIPIKGYKVAVHHNIFEDYKAFDGQALLLPADPFSIPSKLAVDEHNNQFNELWTVI